MLDVLKPLGDLKIIQAELEGFGIRLNKKPPQITVKKKERGGISLTNTVPLTHIDADEIKAVLSEYKLNSCDIAIRQPEATLEDLIDVIEGNRSVHATSLLGIDDATGLTLISLRLFAESMFLASTFSTRLMRSRSRSSTCCTRSRPVAPSRARSGSTSTSSSRSVTHS